MQTPKTARIIGNACWFVKAIRLLPLYSSSSGDNPYKQKTPRFSPEGCLFVRSLTMTYFHMGNPHYHRR
ncbi:MAG: hypothetical protein WAW10_14530, partial [Gallionella sp.]